MNLLRKRPDVYLSGWIDEGELHIREAPLPDGKNAIKALKRIIRKGKKLGASRVDMFFDTSEEGAAAVIAYIDQQKGTQIWTDRRYIEYEWEV